MRLQGDLISGVEVLGCHRAYIFNVMNLSLLIFESE
jgi:hypothetical protein